MNWRLNSHRALAAAAVVAAGVWLGGCGGEAHETPEAVVDELVTTLEQINASLAAIKTREQAEAAVDELTVLADRWRTADRRYNALGEIPTKKNADLEPYRKRMGEAAAALARHTVRLEREGALGAIEPVLVEMGLFDAPP